MLITRNERTLFPALSNIYQERNIITNYISNTLTPHNFATGFDEGLKLEQSALFTLANLRYQLFP